MDLAIAAAAQGLRRDGLVDRQGFRSKCLEPASRGLVSHVEELRQHHGRRGGLADLADLHEPGRPAPRGSRLLDRQARAATSTRRRCPVARSSASPSAGSSARGGRRGGCDHPWNFPLNLNLAKLGPGPRRRQHRRARSPRPTRLGRPPSSAGSSPSRPTSPPACVNVVASSDHLVGEVLTRPSRRHDHLHRFDGHRPAHHGQGLGHREEDLPRAGGKSATSSSRTPTGSGSVPSSAIGVCTHSGQGVPSPPGFFSTGSRYDEWLETANQMMEAVTYGDPGTRGTPGPAHQRQAA